MALKFNMTTLVDDEDSFALLVWLFELPPSVIKLEDGLVTVPATIEVIRVYDRCKSRGRFWYWSEQLFGNRDGICLCIEPYTMDTKGYDLLRKVAGNHPIDGMCNPTKRGWDFKKGLGYRETGLPVPMSNSGIKFQTNSSGLGYRGGQYRHKDSPIRFVAAATQYDPADIDWLINFNRERYTKL
jgi:hypothetical protein